MKYFREVEKGVILYEKMDESNPRYHKLEPNVYKLWDAGWGRPQFDVLSKGDKLVKFKSGIVAEVIADAGRFFSEETRKTYENLKVMHKMGLLFHGKPGTGKTSVCMLIMKELVEKHNAVCLDCTGKTLSFIQSVIEKLRAVQSNPIVLFVDEFDSSLRRDEDRYLTFLDGTDSIDNMIFIACTNYLSKIPKRFKERKSRFKKVHPINSLPEGVYREYLIDRDPTLKSEAVAEFVHYAVEKGMTIDQLKHALIDYKTENLPIKEAVESAMELSDNSKDEEDD